MPRPFGSTPRRTLAGVLAGTAMLGLGLMGCAAQSRSELEIPNGVRVDRDLVYVRRAEQELHADVYSPPGKGPFPAVLVVHGGSWQRGDKTRMTDTAERLAARGYVAVSIDYRLAPEFQFPAPLYDCQEALRWMRANAARLRIDPRHIGGFGYSAGAHLIALLATTDSRDGLEEAAGAPDAEARLQAAVLGAAPIDLRRFRPNGTFARFLGASFDESPELYALASPITFVTPDDPPMFLYHGASDWMVDVSQSQQMLHALQGVGVPAAYFEAPGGHFATFLFDREEVRRAIDFLDQWLKGRG